MSLEHNESTPWFFSVSAKKTKTVFENLPQAVEEWDEITAEIEALLEEGNLEEANELFWQAAGVEEKIVLPKEIILAVGWEVSEDGREPSKENIRSFLYFAEKVIGEVTIH